MDQFKKMLSNIGVRVLVILIIIVVARLLISLVSSITQRVINKNENGLKSKAVTTSMTVFRSASRYGIWFVAIIGIISVIGGVNANNALVTAGVGTIVITLGAQSLFSDILSGIFLVFDRQYEVGDYVKIGQYEGVVKAISIRATYLELGGKKIIIPNGQIKDVVNYHQFVSCMITVPVSYEANQQKVKDVLENVCAECYRENAEDLFEKPTVLGIESFSSSSIDYLIYAKCYPIKHFSIPRRLREKIKERFDENGIEIPFSQIDVHIKNNENEVSH